MADDEVLDQEELEGEDEEDLDDDPNLEEADSDAEEAEFDARTAFEEFSQSLDTKLSDLRRSVGRAQSLAEQAAAKPGADPDLEQALAAIETSFDELVSGIDPEALPAETRDRILATRRQLAVARERKKLKQEVLEEVGGGKPQSTADPEELLAQVQKVEQGFERRIKRAGLDPDDTSLFDWTSYGRLLTTEGVDAASDAVDEAIFNALESDKRRSSRKKSASKSPRGGGEAKKQPSLMDIVRDKSRPLHEREAALRKASGR